MFSVFRTLVAASAFVLATANLAAQAKHPAYGSAHPVPNLIVDTGGAPNNAHAMKQHYVVLVSLDGFRYDYPKLHGAPHLDDLVKIGATAPDGMLPSYPSLTFPNHWTLVTGLLPEHHGIVRNSFYDPARHETYQYKDPKTSSDGSWYGGVPLWSLARQQGMRAATFMWPGSEAEVAGYRPNNYAKFEDQLDGHVGIEQVLAWLKLPAAQRPHLITFYMPTADHAGHWYGPDSVQEHEAVHILDALMGELRARLNATGLPIDLIIVSDHGMILNDNNWIQWDQHVDLKDTKVVEWSFYPKTETEAQSLYEQFRAHPDPRFTVYRRKDTPAYLHLRDNPRNGDPVVVPNGPYIAHPHATSPREDLADHGYDVTRMPQMKAYFLATGPDIRRGVKLPSFTNLDVYDFVSKLLDLKPAPNDGTLKPLLPALKK
jgi:alkaline phosphatase D